MIISSWRDPFLSALMDKRLKLTISARSFITLQIVCVCVVVIRHNGLCLPAFISCLQ